METESSSCHHATLLGRDFFVRGPFSGVLSYAHIANLCRKRDPAHLRGPSIHGERSSFPKQAIQEGLSRRAVVPSVVYKIAEPLGP